MVADVADRPASDRGSPRARARLRPSAADQVVEHPTSADAGGQELVNDRGADRSGTAGDEHRRRQRGDWSSSHKLRHLGQPRPRLTHRCARLARDSLQNREHPKPGRSVRERRPLLIDRLSELGGHR